MSAGEVALFIVRWAIRIPVIVVAAPFIGMVLLFDVILWAVEDG